MSEIVVIGAGFAGLYSALLLARRGHSVLILEQDSASPPDDPEACFSEWPRRGVAQARQPHLLLNRTARVLQDQTPEVLAAFVGRGANLLTASGERVGPEERERLFLTCGRRLPLEATLRRLVLAEPGVELRSGVHVSGLVLGDRTVRGVRLDDGAEVPAELVLDCAGRWSRSREWLSAEGIGLDPERRQDCDFVYLTMWRRRRSDDFPSGGVPRRALSPFGNFLCYPADGTVFGATMTLSMKDPLKGRCRDPEAFERVFAAIPAFEGWLEGSEPISGPEVTARIENCWRTLLEDGRPAVGGLLLVGDSAMHTNPTLGRGVGLAFLQAARLPDLLERHPPASPELLAAFEAWRADELGPWYLAQVDADARRLAQLDQALAGQEVAEPTDPRGRFAAAVAVAAAEDPAVSELSLRFFHMLATPAELAADPRVQAAVQKVFARGAALTPPGSGPSRAEFEAALG